MPYRPAAIVAGLATAVCLLLSGVTGAAAQVRCWMANSEGPPDVHDAHIFCGEINRHGTAVGFHSRPGGFNPRAHNGQQIIKGGFVTAPPNAPYGIYELRNFTITRDGVTDTKERSTMFPDDCTQESVLAAIRNAAARARADAGSEFKGMSGPACTANGVQFRIKGYTNASGDILTAYPDY